MIRPQILLLVGALLGTPVFVATAQGTSKPAAPKPVLSPRDTARGTVGNAKVFIDYGRPSKRNRLIFGGIVRYDKIWRTGANEATTLVTDKPLLIGKSEVPAGTYTIFTLPGAQEWQLIVNKQTSQWGTVYDAAKDLVRIPMAVKKIDPLVEKFEISIDGSGVLHMKWENTEATVQMTEKK